MLIDYRPRRMAVALPPALPLPLICVVFDTIFGNFYPPYMSIMPAPMLTMAAAGLRAALVVDIGWAETTVTAVYEYREVQTLRTIRAGKMLGQEMLKVLGNAVLGHLPDRDVPEAEEKAYRNLVSFEECEEVIARMAYSNPSKHPTKLQTTDGSDDDNGDDDDFHDTLELPTDDIDAAMGDLHLGSVAAPQQTQQTLTTAIPLHSTMPPTSLNIPTSALALPTERAFFATSVPQHAHDDNELPLPHLIHLALLRLPLDIRALCMARILFAGGSSNIPGLQHRILDDVRTIHHERGWDPVCGRAAKAMKEREARNRSKLASLRVDAQTPAIGGPPASALPQEPDPILSALHNSSATPASQVPQHHINGLTSLGSWAGASLLSQLKVPAIVTVEREQWLQYGIAGATRGGVPVSVAPAKRASGVAALRGGAADKAWGLGAWG